MWTAQYHKCTRSFLPRTFTFSSTALEPQLWMARQLQAPVPRSRCEFSEGRSAELVGQLPCHTEHRARGNITKAAEKHGLHVLEGVHASTC